MASITKISTHPRYIPDNYLCFMLPDGKIVSGINATEVVQEMADEKMSTPKSLSSYRRSVARRLISTFPEIIVNASSNGQFVRSLIACGQLTPIDRGK